MSKGFFTLMIRVILILIILNNTLIAFIFFKASGYKWDWELVGKSKPIEKIEVTEVSKSDKKINYNKININTKKGILEVFENIFIKENKENKVIKIRRS